MHAKLIVVGPSQVLSPSWNIKCGKNREAFVLEGALDLGLYDKTKTTLCFLNLSVSNTKILWLKVTWGISCYWFIT